MSRLSLKHRSDPEWIVLGAGVELCVKPLGQLHLDRAEARASAAAREMVHEASCLSDYGLEAVNAGDLFDPDDIDLTAGSGQFLFAVELAMISVVDWRGFDDEHGRDIAGSQINRRGLALLFQAPIPGEGVSFAHAFITRAAARPLLERSEGNAFAAALNGDGAPAASVTDALNLAQPAPVADPSPSTD